MTEAESGSGVTKGTLLVVSGPSGVGKSSVVRALDERMQFHFSASWTTRSRRPGEVDGVDYVFVERDEFEKSIAAGEFLEWAEYSGYLYGTPRKQVLSHIDSGENVLLDIENDGAGQVKLSYPESVLVFILPPSLAELERRLRHRGDTSESDIKKRLSVAGSQIEEAHAKFDYLVTNSEVGSVADEIVSILAAADSP
ncbi:MAG: guanylate kinase [bacterium]|nr:guanylate kinase [bacterium]MCP4968279.1 guanylate kinase [bacterium]